MDHLLLSLIFREKFIDFFASLSGWCSMHIDSPISNSLLFDYAQIPASYWPRIQTASRSAIGYGSVAQNPARSPTSGRQSSPPGTGRELSWTSPSVRITLTILADRKDHIQFEAISLLKGFKSWRTYLKVFNLIIQLNSRWFNSENFVQSTHSICYQLSYRHRITYVSAIKD